MNKRVFKEDYFEIEEFKNIQFPHQIIREKVFFDCRFEKCDFHESVFKFCRFSDCIFVNCNLAMAEMDGSVFIRVKFKSSKVVGVNWVKAAWRTFAAHQLIEAIDFSDCALDYSTFMGISLYKVKFLNCSVREVDFSEADLSGADFRGTDLQGSQFRGANLTEANLVGAKNYTIIPSQVKLEETRASLPEALSFLDHLGLVFSYEDRGDSNK